MGLLDTFLNGTGDPQKDAAINRGLLQAGLALMQSRGKLFPALGQAGMIGLQASDQVRQQQQQQQRLGLQDQLLRGQVVDQQRQQELAALPGQFYRAPSQPGVDATGGPETAMDNPANQAGPGGFDMAGYIQALMAKSPVQAMQLQAAMQKDTKPTITKPGDIARGPNGEIVWQNPESAKPNDGPAAVQEYQFAKQQGYKGTFEQWKMAQKPAGVNVTYGAPVAGVDAKGNPVFFQPDKAGGTPSIIPGVAPPKKDTPAALQEKLAQNSVTLEKIDKALSLVGSTPGSLGLQNYAGDAIMQRLDPKGVEVRAVIADIGGQKIHDRSGAAVTVGESERLKPYIPAATDSPDTVTKKLKLFRDEYAAMQQAIQSGASVTQAASKGSGVRKFNPATGRIE